MLPHRPESFLSRFPDSSNRSVNPSNLYRTRLHLRSPSAEDHTTLRSHLTLELSEDLGTVGFAVSGFESLTKSLGSTAKAR